MIQTAANLKFNILIEVNLKSEKGILVLQSVFCLGCSGVDTSVKDAYLIHDEKDMF